MKARAKIPTKVTVKAVITRADGTIEDLGIIAQSEKPTLWKRIKKWLLQS